MNRSSVVRGLFVIAFALAVVVLYRSSPGTIFETAATWSRERPVAGALTYIVVVGVATVAFLPGSVSMMLGGFLFGTMLGSMYALVGIALGAQLAFFAGRMLGRSWIEQRLHDNERMRAIDSAIHEQAFTIVLLTRLALLIPFNILNYIYGITAVRPLTYFRATVAGMLPVVVLYVYIGSLARNVGQIMSGEAAPSQLAYWLAGAGFVVIAAVTWLIHRAASRALKSRLYQT